MPHLLNFLTLLFLSLSCGITSWSTADIRVSTHAHTHTRTHLSYRSFEAVQQRLFGCDVMTVLAVVAASEQRTACWMSSSDVM
jgi:hypothetical protein